MRFTKELRTRIEAVDAALAVPTERLRWMLFIALLAPGRAPVCADRGACLGLLFECRETGALCDLAAAEPAPQLRIPRSALEDWANEPDTLDTSSAYHRETRAWARRRLEME